MATPEMINLVYWGISIYAALGVLGLYAAIRGY